MKAAVLTRFGAPLELADDVEIDSPGVGEVLVRVTHCGVCHSDLSIAAGEGMAYPLPAILGHEAAGVVETVGAGVSSLAEGQPVVLSMRNPCGKCYQCTRGMPVLCDGATGGRFAERLRWRGQPVMRVFGLGAFAEYVLVEEHAAVPIAPDTPRDVAAVVGCAVQTGVGAVTNLTGLSPGASALVIGAGTVGLCVIQGARLSGATTIIAIDPLPARREQAITFGATHALDSGEPDLVDRVKALTGGRGADYAFDIVGNATTPELAMACLIPGGHALVVGSTSPANSFGVSTTALLMEQKTIGGCLLGNCHPQRDFARFIALWRTGQLEIDRLVTATRPLEEIGQAMDDLIAGRGLRTVIAL